MPLAEGNLIPGVIKKKEEVSLGQEFYSPVARFSQLSPVPIGLYSRCSFEAFCLVTAGPRCRVLSEPQGCVWFSMLSVL